MSLILKVMVDATGTLAQDAAECSLFGDVTACHFKHNSDGSGGASISVREPVKTGLVPGFVENEKHVVFFHAAYLMNDNGRTITTFRAKGGADAEARLKNPLGETVEAWISARVQPDNRFIAHLPYETVAAIRRLARAVAGGDRYADAQKIMAVLDSERVAVDA